MGMTETSLYERLKRTAIRTPLLSPLIGWWYRRYRRPRFVFRRERPDGDARAAELVRIRNLLAYAKTAETDYAGKRFPAGYHTLRLDGESLAGRRDPVRRLEHVPFDFAGKLVLDIGCNQGGMLFPLASAVRGAVGVDFDARLINAANRIARHQGHVHLGFYVHDLEREPLELIDDFVPDARPDIVFLLAICNWIDNWRDVIAYCASRAEHLLFESNGPEPKQREQIDALNALYARVERIAERSDDDAAETGRQLFLCSN